VISAAANFQLMIHTRPPIRSSPTCAASFSSQQPHRATPQAIGITPVVMPVNEVALAIGRGTIVARPCPNSLFGYGVSRITRFTMTPLGAHRSHLMN
jgi:hypothetical protein